MRVYHISSTLQLGDALTPDHQKCAELSEPFVLALERSEDCFYGMVLNGKYLYSVLGKFKLWEWSDYAKWATEGAFEYIRKTEYPNKCSRLGCNYFHGSPENSRKLFIEDWGNESEEDRNKIRLYEIELEDDAPDTFDMRIYDEAYDAMCRTDIAHVLACARRYFAGGQSKNPVWEILSSKPAVASEDISHHLKDCKPTV